MWSLSSKQISVYHYTQCTVKLRSNFEKIAQLKCTANEKRNLSEHDEKKFKLKNFLWYLEKIL